MMMPRHLMAIALLLEFASVGVLLTSWPWGWQLLAYSVLHALATPWLARALWHQLPRRYRVPANTSILFLSVMIFTLPFVGFIGVLWGLMMALRLPRQRRHLSVTTIALPALPFQTAQVFTHTPYSQGALRQILHCAQGPLKRVKAVMAMRQMPLQRVLPILNIALRDRVDDVRLLAYAMRDSEEKTLTESIQDLHEQLDELTPAKQAAAYAVLSQRCFELVFSGLVQGAVRQHWLAQALLFNQKATPSIHNAILLARIHLQRADFAVASQALSQAESLGADIQSLAVWRAEVAFGLRQFNEVAQHMSAVAINGERGSDLAMVKTYWQVHSA